MLFFVFQFEFCLVVWFIFAALKVLDGFRQVLVFPLCCSQSSDLGFTKFVFFVVSGA